ncbi:MAG TPA: S8 family serine peptidase [Cyclobacteriaceae bacterium]
MLYSQSKLSPKFYTPNTRVANDTSIIQLSVGYHDFESFIRSYKNRVTILHSYKQANVSLIKARYDIAIKEFSLDSNIIFVDIIREATPEAGTDYFNTAFNRINMVRDQFPSLNGINQKILIKEQRFDTTNIDLQNRSFKTTLASATTSQHATTIATMIAGAGNASEKTEGVANHALIGSSDFENLLPDADDVFISGNIHLENHSYGVDVENYYGNEAAAYDQQVYANPTIQHVFSAGNSGGTLPTDGTYKNIPYANLSGNFKQAKNIITITSVDTSFTVNTRNSKGPAYDGRVKPELTAFGQDGTSDAAAIGTGVCSLLQQRYEELYQKSPTVAEIKSILIASADDVGQEGIDYSSGYGSINAIRALSLLNEGNIANVTVNKDAGLTLPINVPSSTHKLTVAITWIDPPAIQNSSTALVNDVDAVLSDGTTNYFPWTLSTKPLADSLNAKAVRGPDHLNTVEYFSVDEPLSGSYQLTITAPAIAASQSVTVAYWLEKEKSFEWNYPTHDDKLQAHQKTILLWNVQHKDTGTLSLQLNNGNWQTIKEDINLHTNFHWQPPDTLSWARLKMKIDEQEFVSDSFMISPKPSLNVAFDCDSQFALSWKAVPGADAYEIYTLDNQYLKLFMSATDTTVTLLKSMDYYFTVAPKFNTSIGLKSETINYSNQGALCYINLFDAQRYEDDRITLQLTLSSLLNIDRIIIYKIIAGDTTQLTSESSNSFVLNNTLYDKNLVSGEMQYMAEVVLSNGVHIKSDIHSVFIEQKGKVVLFPNPIYDDELNVLSEGEGLRVVIINLLGDALISRNLISTLDKIDTTLLIPGLYILELLRNNTVLDSKKFLKL